MEKPKNSCYDMERRTNSRYKRRTSEEKKKTGTTPAKLNTDLIFALSLLTDKQLEDVKRFWKILDSSGRETAWRACAGIEAPAL